MKPKQRRKVINVSVGTGAPSLPANKLRANHGTSDRPTTDSKSMAVIQGLLSNNILNFERGVEPLSLFLLFRPPYQPCRSVE